MAKNIFRSGAVRWNRRDVEPAALSESVGSVSGPILSPGTNRGSGLANWYASWTPWIRVMRPEHWVKNLLVFVPALLNHRLDAQTFNVLFVTFVAFSCISSACYINNDLFDLAADRTHPRKCTRPLASRELAAHQAIIFSAGLALLSMLLGSIIGAKLVTWLVTYAVLGSAYSYFLKGKRIIDVIVLATLYTLRLYAGGVVTGTHVSAWLFLFSTFLFLSLAFVKRFSEVQRLSREGKLIVLGRNYRSRDLSMIGQSGIACAALAGLVLVLFVNDNDLHNLYPQHRLLWALCPLIGYWICRVWTTAYRGLMKEDPIVWAFQDRVTYIVGIMIVITTMLASAGHAH